MRNATMERGMRSQTDRFLRHARFARTLRNNATEAEHLLWRHLRLRQLDGCKFRRQHPFCGYVLDFVCLERRLVVEVDGGQHSVSTRDERRDATLRQHGFAVLRFWNTEVRLQRDAVVERILQTLRDSDIRRRPSPRQGVKR